MVFKHSFLLAFAVSTVNAASTTQCCSSIITASDSLFSPILSLLNITFPTTDNIGIGCQPINTSCAGNCAGQAVSCSVVAPSVFGNIGVACTPLPACKPPCTTIGTETSPLYGANTGNPFNDLVAVAGNGTLTTDNAPSIEAITLRYGSVVDGLAVTYGRGARSSSMTISHGTSVTAIGPANTTVTLNANETIIGVSGQSGTLSPYGNRVLQISFKILDSSTGATRFQGPFGLGTGTAFNVTDGPLLALSGFAVNTDSDLATSGGKLGGLYGLSFITSKGLNCTA
ncbi:hypothetical protein C8R45DRAFT_1165454 [Mycena sanguinolenta]|nr:hypothetical protein C8R45DRAFT_1165454 [Mycena sanguinolenta]